MSNLPATPPNGTEDGVLPPIGEVVLVQCENFKCLAVRDKMGKWRSPFSKMELPRILRIVKRN
ncbi:MAG: hypothetical protein ABSE16_19005 [Verrucomicrobiota bacterium]